MHIDITHLQMVLLQAEGAENSSLWGKIIESNLINLLIVVGAIVFLVKKNNLLGGIDTHHQKVSGELNAVELKKKEALAQLEEAKRRTASLNQEVEAILKDARQSAETLSAQIVADARTESKKIVENARKRVELEQRSAAKDLERRLLNDALSDARIELANNLSPTDRRRSVETFLEELSQAGRGK